MEYPFDSFLCLKADHIFVEISGFRHYSPGFFSAQLFPTDGTLNGIEKARLWPTVAPGPVFQRQVRLTSPLAVGSSWRHSNTIPGGSFAELIYFH